MKHRFFAFGLLGFALGFFVSINASEAYSSTLPTSAITSKYANSKVLNPFEVTVAIFPTFTPCQRISGIGFSVENAATGATLTNYPFIQRGYNEIGWSDKKFTFSVDPRNWGTGTFQIRGVTVDSCGNQSSAQQSSSITVIVPEILQLKFVAPLTGIDTSQESKVQIQVSYDPGASEGMISTKRTEKISFSTLMSSNAIFNCSNLIPKNSVDQQILTESSSGCTFRIKPYQGVYEWFLKVNNLPPGLYPLTATVTDSNGISYLTNTNFIVPKLTTTTVLGCESIRCNRKISGQSQLVIVANTDPLSKVSVSEVGIESTTKVIEGKDLQGNVIVSSTVNGLRSESKNLVSWKISDRAVTFPITLDTTSWENGNYLLNAYSIDSVGIKSSISLNLMVENVGPIIDLPSIRVPKGDIEEDLRLSIAAISSPGSSAKIKNIQVLVNGKSTTDGLIPNFKFKLGTKNDWEVSDQTRFGWSLNLAKPRNVLENQQQGFFALSTNRQNYEGAYSDDFQFLITDTYGRQTISPVYKSEITCNPCRKLVVRDSSISAQGGDVSKAQLISFDVDIPSQAISTVSRVRVLRDGKPVTEGLEPQFDNSGIRGDGWAVDKGSKFTWKLKFGSSDQIIFDNQKGFWNVPVADDPEVDPRISSKLSFEVIDNFGRTTFSSVIPEFLITCLECEKRIKEGLKNIRLAKRYQRDAQSALENIDAYLSTAQGYQSALNSQTSQADADKKDSEAEFKKLGSGFKHTFSATKSRKKVTVLITESRWDQTCSNQNSRPDGEKKLGAAKGAYGVSEQSWNGFRSGLSTVNSSVGTIRERRSSANSALARLKNIANADVVSNDQAKDAKALLDEILKYEKDAQGEVNQARGSKESAESKLKEIDQAKEIKKLVDIFFRSAIACLSGEERLASTQGSIDGDKSATKTKTTSAILCVSPDGKQRQVVKGASPKCPPGLVKKNY